MYLFLTSVNKIVCAPLKILDTLGQTFICLVTSPLAIFVLSHMAIKSRLFSSAIKMLHL